MDVMALRHTARGTPGGGFGLLALLPELIVEGLLKISKLLRLSFQRDGQIAVEEGQGLAVLLNLEPNSRERAVTCGASRPAAHVVAVLPPPHPCPLHGCCWIRTSSMQREARSSGMDASWWSVTRRRTPLKRRQLCCGSTMLLRPGWAIRGISGP